MKRRALAGFVLGVAALLASSLVPLPASVQAQGSTPSGGHEVEVRARRLASGNVEFGLRVTNPADGSVSYPELTNRFFLYDSSTIVVGKWYYSEDVSVGEGAGSALVEVRARRLASGNLEFGLRLFGRTSWQPKARYFIYGSARPGGPWMYSSVFTTEAQSDLYSVGSICANGTLVPDPVKNRELVGDCISLLAAKQTLKQSPSVAFSPHLVLNWGGDRKMSTSYYYSQWNGLTVISRNLPRRVQELGIYYITSVIPVELTELDGLTNLQLFLSSISGATPASGVIPEEIGRLSNLETLYIQIRGSSKRPRIGSLPSSICKLLNVKELTARNISLGGTIPSCLESLNQLTTLSLDTNYLTGSVPAWLDGLSDLEILHLHNNLLSGGIPVELGNLTNLEVLFLYRNNLSGGIPAELGNLTKLRILYLFSNNLSGGIPVALGNLTNLSTLYLNNNNLSGGIPVELGNLTKLQDLRLNGNNLIGGIPAALGNLTKLSTLLLHGNNLSGGIPVELGNLTKLKELHLHGTNLTGCVPASLKTYIHEVTRYDEDWNKITDTTMRPITITVPSGLKENGAIKWCAS